MPGLFVSGTDTGVGKTVVAAIFTLGLGADYWKPIQTGSGSGTDRERVATWTKLARRRFRPEAYCLPQPASPHLAAAAAGIGIERAKLSAPAGARPLVVEGAGGLLVPLDDTHTMLDLIGWLRLPVLLVARTRLGTINHTLLSLEALQRRRLPVAGVVMHGSARPEVVASVRARTRARVTWLPWVAGLTPAELRGAWRKYLEAQYGGLASAVRSRAGR